MYFCGNPFFTSCPRQVSPVYEVIRFHTDRNRVCTHCQYGRPIVGIGDRNGLKSITEAAGRTVFPTIVRKKRPGVAARTPHFSCHCPTFDGETLNFGETKRHQRPVRILFARAMFLQFVGETRAVVEFLADWQAHVATLDSPGTYPLSESPSCVVLI